jgi:hypothetical protein
MKPLANRTHILVGIDFLQGQAAALLDRAERAKKEGNPDMDLRGDAISCDACAEVLRSVLFEDIRIDREEENT